MNDFVENKRTSDKNLIRAKTHRRFDRYDGDEDLDIYVNSEDQKEAAIDNLSNLSKGSFSDSSLNVDSNIMHQSASSNSSLSSHGFL